MALLQASSDPIDVLTVTISKHPINEGLALLVRAEARTGAETTGPTPRAGMARDRIMRRCSYLVG